MGFCDFKDVAAFGNNQLWRPLAAKVIGHHSGLPRKMVSLLMSTRHGPKYQQEGPLVKKISRCIATTYIISSVLALSLFVISRGPE